jgi:hypothetical protein
MSEVMDQPQEVINQPQIEQIENTKPRQITQYIPGSELNLKGGDYFKHEGRLWRVTQVMSLGLMGQWVSDEEYERRKRPEIKELILAKAS